MCNNNDDVRISEKVLLSFPQAAKLFGIGENKLRQLAAEHHDLVLNVGSCKQVIKRVRLEKFLIESESI